jgi:hypothetical protein
MGKQWLVIGSTVADTERERSADRDITHALRKLIEHAVMPLSVASWPFTPLVELQDYIRRTRELVSTMRSLELTDSGHRQGIDQPVGRGRALIAPIDEEDIRESQRIATQRELANARKQTEILEAQNEKQLDHIGVLARTNADLTEALLGTRSAPVKITEKRVGRVVRVDDGHVVVAYETPSGRVEHVYESTQFTSGKLPDEGDGVVAHAFVVFSQGPVRSLPTSQQEAGEADEFAAFRRKRRKGPIVFE